ncbi:hypothetical protein AGMMS49992_05440 [Clostridia bacterium]|nr:hypothetical protein AGMMS49992_05440 [Clostridia bacterium]
MYTYENSSSLVDITDSVHIDHNSASRDGGGIYVFTDENNSLSLLNITGNAHLEYNDAGRDGGGIYRSFQPIEQLQVSEDVVFKGNHASIPYAMTDAQDIAAQAPYILTHHLTTPFIYAYNNYDINYIGSPALFGVAQARVRVCWTTCSNGGANGYKFLVGMYDCNCQLVARAVYDSDETVTFSPVLLPEPGEYCYTMRMVCSNARNMHLDPMVFSVCFNVTQGKDGELVAEVTYPQGRPLFQNLYMGF